MFKAVAVIVVPQKKAVVLAYRERDEHDRHDSPKVIEPIAH